MSRFYSHVLACACGWNIGFALVNERPGFWLSFLAGFAISLQYSIQHQGKP